MLAGQPAFGCAFLAFQSFRKDFRRILTSSTGAVIGINAANELINLGGGLGTRYALVLAPMSLVQAAGSTTTVFVFVFGVALSFFSQLWVARTCRGKSSCGRELQLCSSHSV
jgi:hypothetical protein